MYTYICAEGKVHKSPNSVGMTFISNFIMGGISGAISRTVTAPLDIGSKIARRHRGIVALWKHNLSNVYRYFHTQAFCFAFNDIFQDLMPTYNAQSQFNSLCLVKLISGGLAGATTLSIVYPLDFARSRLAVDVRSGRRIFSSSIDYMI